MTARLFVAIRPDADTVEALGRLVHDAGPDVRLVPEASWHVTLRFLGDVDTAEAMLAVLADDASLPARSRSVDVSALRIGVARAWMTGHTATDAAAGAEHGDDHPHDTTATGDTVADHGHDATWPRPWDPA
ncbi:MAG: 2'-5' RNA ligase family protein, partial [Ilumatobacteraceae bacterium]